jgi:chromosome segregation ATPase
MQEYMKVELEKVIKDQKEKIHSKVQALHLKLAQRARLEGEVVELKEEIEKTESFIDLMDGMINEEEDRLISAGLKLVRRAKSVRKANDDSEPA